MPTTTDDARRFAGDWIGYVTQQTGTAAMITCVLALHDHVGVWPALLAGLACAVIAATAATALRQAIKPAVPAEPPSSLSNGRLPRDD